MRRGKVEKDLRIVKVPHSEENRSLRMPLFTPTVATDLTEILSMTLILISETSHRRGILFHASKKATGIVPYHYPDSSNIYRAPKGHPHLNPTLRSVEENEKGEGLVLFQTMASCFYTNQAVYSS